MNRKKNINYIYDKTDKFMVKKNYIFMKFLLNFFLNKSRIIL
jgi:hypothetical protein